MKFQDVLRKADDLQEKIIDQAELYYKLITPKHILLFLLAFHWFSTSGCVYNMINNVPPYAETVHGMELLAPDGQYSFEGMFSGLLTVGSAVCFILFLKGFHDSSKSMKQVWTYFCGGALGCAIILRMYRIKKSY